MNWETGDDRLNFRLIPSVSYFCMPTRKGRFFVIIIARVADLRRDYERFHNVGSQHDF